MRKIVLAAAIAGSALGLAACAEAETEVDETTAYMEAVADEATAEAEEGMEAAGEAMEDGAEAMEEGAEEAAAEAEAAMEGE